MQDRLPGHGSPLALEKAALGIARVLLAPRDQRGVDGAAPEQRVPGARAQRLVDRVDPDEDAAHLRNRVHAEIGARSVGGPPSRLELEGDEALVRDRDVHGGRLGHDRGVGAPFPHDRLGADAADLLVDDRGHDHVAAQPAARCLAPGKHDRGEAALHVERPAPVEAPVLDPRREPVLHRGNADRVGVCVQHQRPAAAAPPRDCDDVRPSGSGLLDLDLEPCACQPVGDEPRDFLFARRAWNELGVHGVDRNQLRGQLRDFPHRRHPIVGAGESD